MTKDSAAQHAVTAQLESALGYVFTRPELLLHALTHKSLAHERQLNGDAPTEPDLDNERLEFLGDAVLGMLVAEALYAAHPDWTEGELTRIRAQLVSRAHMAKVAAELQLGRSLLLGYGEEHSGGRKKSAILANSMEAVLAAIYLDGGLAPARALIERLVMGKDAEELAEGLKAGAALGDHKSALQEYLQAEKLGSPMYAVRGESGPDHRKRFLVEVRLKASSPDAEQNMILAMGQGRTKKRAEQAAARRALARLLKQDEPADDSNEDADGE